MKEIRFLFVFCLMAVCNGLNAQANEQVVTFIPGTDKSEVMDVKSPQSISKDGVTISLDYYDYDNKGNQGCGILYRDENYRIYQGSLFTISYNAGNIVKVELNNYDSKKYDLDDLELENDNKENYKPKYDNKKATWTGSSSQVSWHIHTGHAVWLSKITVTVEKVNHFSISKSGYATFCIDVPYIMPAGVTGYTISDVENEVLKYGQTYNAGETVPEGVALLLKGEKNDYSYTVSDNTGMTKPQNMLKGSDGSEVKSETSLLYKLSYDNNGENVGFYWNSKDGKSIKIPAGKAYLEVPEQKASAKGFALDETPTGISEINDEKNVDGKVFSISGRYVGKKTEGLAKGIYIRNGKKITVQ